MKTQFKELNAYLDAVSKRNKQKVRVEGLEARRIAGTNGLSLNKDAAKAIKELEDQWYALGSCNAEVNRTERVLKNKLLKVALEKHSEDRI